MAEDLTKLKLPELREMARERGIKPVYGINKAQLIEKLQSTEREVQSADNKNKEKTEKEPKNKPTTKPKQQQERNQANVPNLHKRKRKNQSKPINQRKKNCKSRRRTTNLSRRCQVN